VSPRFEVIEHPAGASLSPVHMARLPNGVSLLVKEMPHSPAAYVSIWCQTGAAHEDPRHAGISHFLEHMFFKGTERFGPGEMDRVIKGIGGDNNAATSLEYTCYYAAVPAERYQTALEVLVDALRHSVFDGGEIERERQVVVEEIARKEDDPEGKVFLDLQETLGADSPYGRSVLGTPEALASIDGDVFRAYLAERYTAPNLCLVVAGDVRRDAVYGAVDGFLADAAAGSPNRVEPFGWQPVAAAERRIPRDVQHTYLALGMRTPGLADLDLAYDLELLATVLGEGRSSRLVRRLREELGIVTSISAWTWDLTAGGVFAVSASLEPAHEAQVREEVGRMLREVCEQPITPRELERARTMAIADYRMSTETAADVGETLGYAHVTTGVAEALRYVERLRAVSPERLQRAARDWLTLDHAVTVTLHPQDGALAPHAAAGAAATGDGARSDDPGGAMDDDDA
jgi:zinc protease